MNKYNKANVRYIIKLKLQKFNVFQHKWHCIGIKCLNDWKIVYARRFIPHIGWMTGFITYFVFYISLSLSLGFSFYISIWATGVILENLFKSDIHRLRMWNTLIKYISMDMSTLYIILWMPFISALQWPIIQTFYLFLAIAYYSTLVHSAHAHIFKWVNYEKGLNDI